jgi:hypothetical protein
VKVCAVDAHTLLSDSVSDSVGGAPPSSTA